MSKNISYISDLRFEDLKWREHGNALTLPIPDSFRNDPLLEDAHKMSQIAFPYPKDDSDLYYYCSDWYGCDIFGNRYTLGLINSLSHEEFKKLKYDYCLSRLADKYPNDGYKRVAKEILRKELRLLTEDFHKEVLKPIQDKYIKGLQERYLSIDIIASLLAMNIDPVIFWYAVLWLKDYVDAKTENVIEYEDTPLESFDNLSILLNSVTDSEYASSEQKMRWFNASENNERVLDNVNGILTLKVGLFKKVTVTNPETLRLLGKIISDYTDKYRNRENTEEYAILNSLREVQVDTDGNNNPITLETKKRQVSYLTKLFLFHKYMKEFLKEVEGDRNLCVSDVITGMGGAEGNKLASIDKELLICRLAWVIDYVRKDKFYDNPKAIKDALKGFNEANLNKLYSNIYYY